MNIFALFPMNAHVDRNVPKSLALVIVAYLIICAVVKVIDILVGWMPLIGIIIGVIGWIIGLYCAVGIILAVVAYVRKTDE